jgi:hypothetical protein
MELDRVHGQRRRRFVDKRRTSLYTTPAPPKGHRHVATIDTETGNGRTDTVEGHFHFVEALEVRPAHGHYHELTTTRGLR